jgi:hypothetical protein
MPAHSTPAPSLLQAMCLPKASRKPPGCKTALTGRAWPSLPSPRRSLVTAGISQGIGLTGTDFTSSLARGFLGGVVTQRIRMAVYNEGKLDYAAIAADAFGNGINGVSLD